MLIVLCRTQWATTPIPCPENILRWMRIPRSVGTECFYFIFCIFWRLFKQWTTKGLRLYHYAKWTTYDPEDQPFLFCGHIPTVTFKIKRTIVLPWLTLSKWLALKLNSLRLREQNWAWTYKSFQDTPLEKSIKTCLSPQKAKLC